MPNYNDAKITSLYVNADGPASDIEDEAPNATNPGGTFDVTLEMVAGSGLAGTYTLSATCVDLTIAAPAPAALKPGNPLNSAAVAFGDPAYWKAVPPMYTTFNQSVTVGPGVPGHVYQYTAALHTANGQVVSIKQSEPFILL